MMHKIHCYYLTALFKQRIEKIRVDHYDFCNDKQSHTFAHTHAVLLNPIKLYAFSYIINDHVDDGSFGINEIPILCRHWSARELRDAKPRDVINNIKFIINNFE